MPRYTVKLTDGKDNKEYYLVWSTIVDAPVTYGMSKENYMEWYKEEYGRIALEEWLQGKRNMADIEEFLNYNRAGENEEQLDKEGILNKYCRE